MYGSAIGSRVAAVAEGVRSDEVVDLTTSRKIGSNSSSSNKNRVANWGSFIGYQLTLTLA